MKKLLLIFCTLLLLSGCSSLKNSNNRNSETVIALLDSGVSTATITSDHLRKGYNYVTDSTDTEDKMNHGTALASIFLGCESAEIEAKCPFAYVVPLVVVTKVENETTTASPDTLAKAIRESIDVYEADIINVSLGITEENDALIKAILYAEKKGVLVVSAVGNDGKEGKSYFPASYKSVLAVGSYDKNGNESAFSQPNSDVLAQGEDIVLASAEGQKYVTKGTSYATGFVTATAANFLSGKPRVKINVLWDYLKLQQYYQ